MSFRILDTWPLAWPSLEAERQGRQETKLLDEGSYGPHLEIQALGICLVLSLSTHDLTGGGQSKSLLCPPCFV